MKWVVSSEFDLRSFTSMMAITNLIRFNTLWGDRFGSITVAVVSPLDGIGSLGGLYEAVCGGFFAALFGGTATLAL